MKIFIYTVISVVAVSVIAGFFIVGSPKEERLRRFDERRVNDLQFLQGEIINYWINKEKLPENLTLIKDDVRGVAAPKDPETGADYQYTVKGKLIFSLCADFASPSLSVSENVPKPAYPDGRYYGENPAYGGANWQHGAGLVCFERTIDEDIYRPVKLK